MRRAAFLVALCAIWALILAWSAGVPWSAPLTASRQVILHGRDFHPVIGAGIEDEEGLGVGAIADDGNAVQSTALEHVQASDYPILRYRFDDFPRTLDLSLVFRRADSPNELQAVALPWPGDGAVSVNLSALPDWRGQIVEVGFAEYATAQLVPQSIAFRPFRLDHAQLESFSWAPVISLLRSAWFGYQAWSMGSINSLGRASELANLHSMPLALGTGGLASLAAALWLFDLRRRRALQLGAIVAALAWVALDARWLDDLHAKHQLTEQLYADKPWVERERLQPDEDTAGLALLAHQQIGGYPIGQRILLTADSSYAVLRLLYFLLPLNAALLDQAVSTVAPADLPAGILIVSYSSKTWLYDEAQATLVRGETKIPVVAVYIGGVINIFRTRGAAHE